MAPGAGFTLIELLVVISIITLLMSIAGPAAMKVRRKFLSARGMFNKRQVTAALNLFAYDNDGFYPESVATVGSGARWNWSDPTKLIGARARSPGMHRAMSEYLRRYIADATTVYCPMAPGRYKYLQQAWDAGDAWDNPERPFPADPLTGTYCFYWNYTGYIGGRKVTIQGPKGPAGARRQSTVLVTDYFGYDHWRTPGSYSSCEKFKGAGVTPETLLSAAYFYRTIDPDAPMPDVQLQAGFIDEHVETYRSHEAVPMEVSISPDGDIPYPRGIGPGVFYLPPAAVR